MSNKVDSRVVELKFDSKKFEDGVATTTQSLAELEKSLQMDGIASAVDDISSKFSIFGAVAFTALQTLTNSAIGFGQRIAGAVLDPLVVGGRKRALNIEQAKFQFKGLGMDVEQSMADALYAVQGTAFGLDEAAVAASQFGASGVQSGAEMQNALRGISGVAAMAGSSYSDMANVFTKVAGQGRLMGDDLNRLGTRGINAASTLADYFNKTGRAANATEADIRAMVTKGEIDFKTFALAMSEAFGEHATAANETYTGSLSNMRAALSRIGAMYYTPQLERMRTIFNALTPAIDAVAKAITPLIKYINELADKSTARLVSFIEKLDFRGLTLALNILVRALRNVGTFIAKIFAPIGKAFDEVFGDRRVKSLTSIVAAFFRFTHTLDVSAKAAERIRGIFKTIFTVLSIVLDILIGAGKIIWSVFSAAIRIIGSFLGIFAPLLDIFTSFQDGTKKTENSVSSLANTFSNFMNKIVIPVTNFFRKMRDAIQVVVDTKLAKWAKDTGENFEPLTWIVEKLSAIFEGLKAFLIGVWNLIKPIATSIGNVIKNIGSAVAELASGLNFNLIFGAANTGILFWFANAIKNLFTDGFDEIKKITGIFSGVKDIFDQVTGVLQAMQTKLKAEALMKIAIAIGILAAAMFLLGSINPDNIGGAVVGMGTIIGSLVAAMAALDKLTTSKSSAVKLPLLALVMNMVAAAILTLSISLKILATMSWDDIGRGLTVLAGGLGILVGSILLLQFAGPKAALAAAALVILSGALLTLAISLKILGSMSWDSIAKGLVSLAAGLVLMVGAILLLQFAGPKAIIAAVALSILAGSLTLLVASIAILGGMKMENLAQGLIALAATIVVLVGAILLLQFAGPMAILAAVALSVLAGSLLLIASAVLILGTMSMENLAKGLIALTAALVVIIGAVLLLGLAGPLAILGAAAMLVMAAALMVITLAIMALAALPGAAIAQAIGTIAAALGILIGLGTAMGLLSPLLIAAGVAIIMLASGILILAVALALLSVLPADGIAAALGAIAAALGILIGLGVALGLLSPILIAGGIALALISVSLLVMAGAMMIFAIALGIFAMNAAPAAEGLSLLAAAMMEIMPAVPALALVGAALIIFGAGALIAGVGITILAISLALMAGALALVAMTAPMGAMALMMLTVALLSIVPHGLELAGLGAAFVVLGAGLLILGVGALLAGVGLIVLATGLRMMAPVAEKGVEALKKVVEAVAGMIWQLPQLALMSVGFLALGAALLLMGTGMLLAGAGGILLAVALKMLDVAANRGAKAIDKIIASSSALGPAIPIYAAASVIIGVLAASLVLAGVGSSAAAAGMLAMLASSVAVIASINRLTSTVSSSVPKITMSFALLGPASLMGASAMINGILRIQNGIQTAIPAINRSVLLLVVGVTTTLISQMRSQTGAIHTAAYNTGYQLSAGLAMGIFAGNSLVVNSAINVASNALRALDDRLDIRSPSRKTFKSGLQYDAGLARGIDAGASMVESASENIGSLALKTLNDAVSGMNESIFDNLDTNPTIRPVLDLSSFEKDAHRLNGFMDFDPIESRTLGNSIAHVRNKQSSASNSIPDSTTLQPVNNYSFVQNNTSPEALSTIEIYRQTKNQISLAKRELDRI